jgi:hypothetical protein
MHPLELSKSKLKGENPHLYGRQKQTFAKNRSFLALRSRQANRKDVDPNIIIIATETNNHTRWFRAISWSTLIEMDRAWAAPRESKIKADTIQVAGFSIAETWTLTFAKGSYLQRVIIIEIYVAHSHPSGSKKVSSTRHSHQILCRNPSLSFCTRFCRIINPIDLSPKILEGKGLVERWKVRQRPERPQITW